MKVFRGHIGGGYQSLMLGQHSVWQCGSGVRGSSHGDIWPYSSCTQPPDPLEVVLIFQACSSSLLWILLASQSVQSLSPTLCDPMDCSTPSFPVYHQLPELAQIHVHRVSGAIQSSHPLSSPSSAFNLSQIQGLFQ